MIFKNDSGREVFANVTIGLQLGITMSIFVYGGYRLDLYFNRSPLFLVIGSIIGMVLGFYHLIKNLAENKNKNQIKDDENVNKKRIKWN